jgi:hypothetical protein
LKFTQFPPEEGRLCTDTEFKLAGTVTDAVLLFESTMRGSVVGGVVEFLAFDEREAKRDTMEKPAARGDSMKLEMNNVPIRATRRARLLRVP